MTELVTKVKIRPATALDAVNIVKLLLANWEEAKVIQLSRVNEHKALRYVNTVLERSFVRVADISGRLIGVIAIEPFQEDWSDDWFLAERWFYVLPPHRTRGIGLRLLDEAEKHADLYGLPTLFGINAVAPEEIDQVFSHRSGYIHMGGNYMRMPRDGKQEADDDREIRSSKLA